MGFIDRNFRLTNEPGGLGLSCMASGLSLAGVPLLRKSETGFSVRPIAEIEALLGAAYGSDVTATSLLPGFAAVARALTRGHVAHAMTVAVLTRLPELNWDAAARLARTENRLRKYNRFEPRDRDGRWTIGDGADDDESSSDLVDPGPANDLLDPHQKTRLFSQDGSQREDMEGELSGSSPLERKYDELGPVELADQAIRFGDRLGRGGQNLSPEERQEALAEYYFLESRVLFWQSYANKPLEADANLKSAAMSLFFGAQNAGIVSVKQVPYSMLTVALDAMALDDSQPGLPLRRPPPLTGMEHESVPGAGRSRSEDFGGFPEELLPKDTATGVVRYADLDLPWEGGVGPRGLAWEKNRAGRYPEVRRLDTWSKTFDGIDDASGEAISEKTLDSLTYTYASKPQNIYSKTKGYIDEVADYKNRGIWRDIDPSQIRSRTIELAIPDYTSPAQWRVFSKAVEYGRQRGVKVNITVDRKNGAR